VNLVKLLVAIVLFATPFSIFTSNEKEEGRNKDLDFILSHLEEPTIFPRTIITKKLGYQKIVYSKEKAIDHFIESDFIDCRINVFPSLKEGATWTPELLFIDLDLSDFNTKRSLQIALNKILKSIKKNLLTIMYIQHSYGVEMVIV
jgi:hypothetical protein